MKYIVSAYLQFGIRSYVSANGAVGLETDKIVPSYLLLHWSRFWWPARSIYEQHKISEFMQIYVFNINNVLEIM